MKILDILLEALSYDEAETIFSRYGGSVGNLKPSYISLIKKYHPDANRGRDTTQQMAMINAAYDVLKGGPQMQQFRPTGRSSGGPSWSAGPGAGRRPGSSGRSDDRARDGGSTPEWAWAGHSGGLPPSSHIYRNDFTDVNFIKKYMWEKSGKSKQQWTIWGYDGAYFRGVTSVFGSPKVFPDMARAMFDWQTKGGNPYKCRAVFVQKGKQKPLYLLYCDDTTFTDKPVMFEFRGGNMNPGNNQQFMRKLPEILDAVIAAHDRGEDPQTAVPI